MLGKLQRAHPTMRGHFALAYLVGSEKLRAYLFFIYGLVAQPKCSMFNVGGISSMAIILFSPVPLAFLMYCTRFKTDRCTYCLYRVSQKRNYFEMEYIKDDFITLKSL